MNTLFERQMNMYQGDMFTGGFARPSVIEWTQALKTEGIFSIALSYDVKLDNGKTDVLSFDLAPWAGGRERWSELDIVFFAVDNPMHTQYILPLYEDNPVEFKQGLAEFFANDSLNIPSDMIDEITNYIRKKSKEIHDHEEEMAR